LDAGVTSPADLVFLGGRAFCADASHSFVDAVAIREGRIAAVGSDDVRALIGQHTEQVDIAGGLLVPGFQDAHVHPAQGGLERMRCDLSELSTREEYVAEVRRYAEANPDQGWIRGGGWAMAAFPGGTPLAADLDAVVPDRPVVLPNRDHHGLWVNSRALEIAGIDVRTPDPHDGRIERDASGEPTGTLHEGAMDLVGRHLPEDGADELRAGLLEAQRYLHSLGITAWQDAILGDYASMSDASDGYLALAQGGLLTARVVGALWWERDRGAEQIPELIDRRRRYRAGRFAATSVKIMQDGVPENCTAGMLEPYLDGHGGSTTNRGLSFVDPIQLRDHVSALDAEGFQVHIHAIGDRAVREALDALEAARRRNGRGDGRHHIAHIQVIHPDDVARFGQLGVVANMQPLWATYEPQMTDLTIPLLGEQRAGWQYPFRSLQRAGSLLAAGSDWPVSSPDPMWGVHVAVNRLSPDGEGAEHGPFLPAQALDLATALTAYTAGSAYVNHLDDTGTIEVGKLADLAVLDRDVFARPVEEIAAARVLATYVEGHQVF
jgi:predicted amidohydrolase YtcJ